MGLSIQDSYKNLQILSFRLGGEQDYKYWAKRSIETRLVELAELSGLAWIVPDSDRDKAFREHFSIEEYNVWLNDRKIPARYVTVQDALLRLDADAGIDSEEEFYPRFLCLKLFNTDIADWEDVLEEEYDNYHNKIVFGKKLEMWVAQCNEFMPFPADHKEYIKNWIGDKTLSKANISKTNTRQPRSNWQKAVVLLVKAFTDVNVDNGNSNGSPVTGNKQQLAAAFALISGYSEKHIYSQLSKINGGSVKIDKYELGKAKGFLKELIKALEKEENRGE